MLPVAEGSGVPAGEGEFAGTGAEAEGVPAGAGDAELAGLVPVGGFGVVVGLAWAVGFGVVVGGDVVGEAEDGAVGGVTPTVAAGGAPMRR